MATIPLLRVIFARIDRVPNLTAPCVLLHTVRCGYSVYVDGFAHAPLWPTLLNGGSAWLGASVWVSFIAGVVLIQAVDL